MLLSLIEQHRLPITHVSLASVADQYLEQVRALPTLDVDLLADFLQIGGKLLLLKSRALLLSEEPDPVVEETTADLEARLAEYRVFRAAAQQLQELEARGARSYATTREPGGPAWQNELPPLAPGSVDQLIAVWRRLLAEPSRQVQSEIPLPVRASVDERRSAILELLRRQPRIAFAAVAGHTVDEVVAAFLAVLELFRRGLVDVGQDTTFGELRILRPA